MFILTANSLACVVSPRYFHQGFTVFQHLGIAVGRNVSCILSIFQVLAGKSGRYVVSMGIAQPSLLIRD
jgi:hypothetical protein